MREDTVPVSIMMVNNEIGAVEPVEEAAKVIKAKNPDTLFHVDAIQAYGKFRICPKKMGIDRSARTQDPRAERNRILYIRDKVKVKPIIYGGGQQKGMRSGTRTFWRGCTWRGQRRKSMRTLTRRSIICMRSSRDSSMK